jgi:hypothetical protein
VNSTNRSILVVCARFEHDISFLLVSSFHRFHADKTLRAMCLVLGKQRMKVRCLVGVIVSRKVKGTCG